MSTSEPKSSLPLWALILVVGIIVGVSMGRNQSMGLYLPPMTSALAIGREPFALSMALVQLLMGVGAPFSGALIDKYGAGRIIVVCVLAAMAGLYMMYAARSGTDLLMSGALLGIGVSGTGVTSLVGTIGRMAPPEKRLSAIASVGMAAGIGSFVALPVMHFLIEAVGWQASLLWLIAVTALLIPLAWPIRGRPAMSVGPIRTQTIGESLSEAFRHPSFWLLTAGFFVCGFHVAFIMVHLPAFAIDQGLPGWVGPFALSVVGIANIIGTYVAGQSGRFIEKRRGLSLDLFRSSHHLPWFSVSADNASNGHNPVRLARAALAFHHSTHQRPRRDLLWHDLDVDAVRHRVPVASDRLLRGRVARGPVVRRHRLI